ncbi:hypothetical protein M3Y94_00179800 [Aphelenchoides besseyi]|nr:hypothetical protein M3Y94_00179800 [Aphelenchoides besseyi]KAI6236897.1 hypothetical protein M3Y95_00207700 [Aphelenchoides besseyi]
MSSLFYPRKMPFKEEMLFVHPVQRSGVDFDPNSYQIMVGPDMTFNTHQILASKFKTPDNGATSWRVFALSSALSFTFLLLIFFVLKLIWQRFRAQTTHFDGLVQESPTFWSEIEETALIDEDFSSTP